MGVPGATSDEPETADRFDLGVVLVHGIGRQSKGETLVRWCDALLRWLDPWLAPGGRYEVVETRLRPLSDASASMVVDIHAQERTTRWCIVESWWAESLHTPTFTEILRWSFQTLPWTAATHVEESLARHAGDFRTKPWPNRLGSVVRWLLAVLGGVVLSIFIVPAVLVALLVFAVIGALPIARFRRFVRGLQRSLAASIGDSLILLESPSQESAIVSVVRRDVREVARSSRRVAVIGHSQGAAIAHRALAPTGPFRPPDNVDSLITFGSGLRKLDRLRDLTDEPTPVSWLTSVLVSLALVAGVVALALPAPLSATTRSFLSWLVLGFGQIPIGSIAFAIAFLPRDRLEQRLASWKGPADWARSTATGATAMLALALTIGINVFALRNSANDSFRADLLGGNGWWVGTALVSLSLVSVGAISLLNSRPPTPRAPYMPTVKGWLDLHASADPVPNGPLTGSQGRSVEVRNLASIFRDHSAYWRNGEQFCARLAGSLHELATNPSAVLPGHAMSADGSWLPGACRERERRVNWLVAGRVLIALSALAFVVWTTLMASPSPATSGDERGVVPVNSGTAVTEAADEDGRTADEGEEESSNPSYILVLGSWVLETAGLEQRGAESAGEASAGLVETQEATDRGTVPSGRLVRWLIGLALVTGLVVLSYVLLVGMWQLWDRRRQHDLQIGHRQPRRPTAFGLFLLVTVGGMVGPWLLFVEPL